MADAVEAAAPAVANITVNVRFHAGRWMPTYATQSVSGKGVNVTQHPLD